MELAETGTGRCRAPVSPPQTHQGGLLGSIGMAVALRFSACVVAGQHHVPRAVSRRGVRSRLEVEKLMLCYPRPALVGSISAHSHLHLAMRVSVKKLNARAG